jgi:hypothetical protein
MFVRRVVQTPRARRRYIYSFSIWSRILMVSMIHELRPATIFRFPTCLTDLTFPPENYTIGEEARLCCDGSKGGGP